MTPSNLTRRRLLRRVVSTTALLGLPGAAARAATDGTLRIGMAAPNTTLDPHLQSNAPNNAVANYIFDCLVTNDAQSHSVPGLAQSWEVLDDTHWRLHLRPDVRFSDGSPCTADDAIATFTRVAALPNGSYRTYTRSIQDMRAEDPHTLLVETRTPDPLLPNSLSRIHVISARFKEASTEDFNAGRAAIGSGPFLLRDYTPGARLRFTRNDAWWGPKPPWTEVELRIISNDGARMTALLAGDLDFIDAVPAEGMDRLKSDARLRMISGVSSRLVYIGVDTARSVTPFITDMDGKPLPKNPLQDLRVRRALSLAINRQAIVERVMQGNAIVASQFLPPGGFGAAPDLQPTPYDPAQAKALLAEAGYPNGFRLTVHGPNNRYINDAKIVQAVAQMFARAGLAATAEVMPWSVYAGRSDNAEFSVFLGSWGVNTGETSNPLVALTATYDRSSGFGVANMGRYSNPQLDALIHRAVVTMDDAVRAKLLAEACDIVFHDAVLLPLHHEVSVWGARRDLTYSARADQYTLAAEIGRKA